MHVTRTNRMRMCRIMRGNVIGHKKGGVVDSAFVPASGGASTFGARVGKR